MQVYWRHAADVTDVLGDQPVRSREDLHEWLYPTPCAIDPERVLECPAFDALPDEIARLWRNWERETAAEPDFYSEFAAAPGYKVGGSMGFNWPSEPPSLHYAECGAPQQLLLQLDSAEN